jgi:hypothetical protein
MNASFPGFVVSGTKISASVVLVFVHVLRGKIRQLSPEIYPNLAVKQRGMELLLFG